MIKSFFKIGKQDHFELLLMVLGIFLMISYYMGFFSPVKGDAVRYAAIGQEMLHNQNFLELQNRGGVPYLQKPPLLFWIISASFKLLGVNHFAYKMPIFLITLLGAFGVYKNALLHYKKGVAQLAVIFMISSFGFIFYQNDIHTDTVIMATIALSIWQLNLFLRNDKWIHLLLGFLFIGLSMMTKGPIGLAIPVFAFGIDVLLKRQWRNIFRWEWIIGLIVIGATISPALIGLYKQFGNEGLAFYFVSNHTDRITGALRANSSDYFFYVHTLLWEYLPWSLFILFGLFQEVRNIIKQKCKLLSTDEAVNIGGIVIFFIIISISKFKGPNYIIPLFPFFAVIAAKWAIRLYEGFHSTSLKWITYIQYLMLFGIWAITIYVSIINIADMPFLLSTSLLCMFLLFGGALFGLTQPIQKMIATASATIIAFGLLFNTFIVPLNFKYHAMLQATELVNSRGGKNSSFVMFNTESKLISDDTFNFYLDPLASYTGELSEIEALSQGWVFTKERDYEILKEKDLKFTEVIKLPHLKRLNFEYLNPSTRERAFKYYYLLKK